MSGVFISYRREDSSYIAGRLHDRLAAALGPERIFRDVDAMKPGVDFTERIDEAVGSCDALLAIIGNDWLSVRDPDGARRIDQPRDWVRLEIAAALARRILVVPVLVENARMPAEDDLPADLRPLARRNAMDLTDRRWHDDTENLLGIVAEVLTPESGAAGPTRPAPATAAGPTRPETGPRPARRPPDPVRAATRRFSALPLWAKVALGVVALFTALLVVGSSWDDDPGGDTGASSAFNDPRNLALDGAGNLYVADPGRDTVVRIALGTGAVSEVTGQPAPGLEEEDAYLTPWAVASAGGNLYVAAQESGGILRLGPDGLVRRVVARAAGVDLPAATAMAVDGEGRLVVATDREVFKIGPDGSLTVLAGGPSKGFGGDGGPATTAKLDSPAALAYGPDGSLYIADSANRRVRRVATDGIITTVAGTGSETPSGDGGPALEAGLGEVSGLAVDRRGTVHLAAGNQVRRIGPDGTIIRVAGHAGNTSGSSGDGGPARDALLDDVHGLAVDADGTLYLVDAGNRRVLRVDAAGILTTVT